MNEWAFFINGWQTVLRVSTFKRLIILYVFRSGFSSPGQDQLTPSSEDSPIVSRTASHLDALLRRRGLWIRKQQPWTTWTGETYFLENP